MHSNHQYLTKEASPTASNSSSTASPTSSSAPSLHFEEMGGRTDSHPGIWHRRATAAAREAVGLLWVAAIYLTTEVLLWGISKVLTAWSISYFAKSVGMVMMFIIAMVAHLLWKQTNRFYYRHIRAKIDFINRHLGAGFIVPIVMLRPEEMLGGSEIGRIICNFILTSLTSWSSVYLLAWGCCVAAGLLINRKARAAASASRPLSGEGEKKNPSDPPRLDLSWAPDACKAKDLDGDKGRDSSRTNSIQIHNRNSSFDSSDDDSTYRSSSPPSLAPTLAAYSPLWAYVKATYPIILSFLCIFFFGIPIAVLTGDHRVLDGCTLWFIWISCLRLQQGLKRYARMATLSSYSARPVAAAAAAAVSYPPRTLPPAPPSPLSDKVTARNARLRGLVATLANPVLLSMLLMMGYTRAKARAAEAIAEAASPGQQQNISLDVVLGWFSAGTPLYELWAALAEGRVVPGNAGFWFGAGDAALSLLECGILVWGLKLYECRRQLFSVAGLLTVVVSSAAALSSVFLSTLMARALGLPEHEVLSFAAKSTTLPLAKPAMAALGGNAVVNAALVVSNGILGQVMYPFVLDKLGVESYEDRYEEDHHSHSLSNNDSSLSLVMAEEKARAEGQTDSPVTIAAGIAIGVNGAAMGVAYLYENKSRAAPYAALSMTVAGLMTVLFTTIDPFQSMIYTLAAGR